MTIPNPESERVATREAGPGRGGDTWSGEWPGTERDRDRGTESAGSGHWVAVSKHWPVVTSDQRRGHIGPGADHGYSEQEHHECGDQPGPGAQLLRHQAGDV